MNDNGPDPQDEQRLGDRLTSDAQQDALPGETLQRLARTAHQRGLATRRRQRWLTAGAGLATVAVVAGVWSKIGQGQEPVSAGFAGGPSSPAATPAPPGGDGQDATLAPEVEPTPTGSTSTPRPSNGPQGGDSTQSPGQPASTQGIKPHGLVGDPVASTEQSYGCSESMDEKFTCVVDGMPFVVTFRDAAQRADWASGGKAGAVVGPVTFLGGEGFLTGEGVLVSPEHKGVFVTVMGGNRAPAQDAAAKALAESLMWTANGQ